MLSLIYSSVKSVFNTVATPIGQSLKGIIENIKAVSRKSTTYITEQFDQISIKYDIAVPTVGLFISATLLTLLSIGIGSEIILPLSLKVWVIEFILKYLGMQLILSENGFSVITMSLILYLLNPIIYVVCILLSTIAAYIQFTVTHDAIHGAISKRKINNVLGFFSQIWLGPTSNWDALKYNHLKHHANTNDSIKDPDYWCSSKSLGGRYLTWLRWLTIELSYFYNYIPYIIRHSNKIANFIAYELSVMLFIYSIYKLELMSSLLMYWIIPSRIAIFILAFAFDYLPHYPHYITRKQDKYKTTAYISTAWYLRPFLSLIIFNQNYHIVHHLKPRVPFYMYWKVWEDMKHELLTEHDIMVRRILPELGEDE